MTYAPARHEPTNLAVSSALAAARSGRVAEGYAIAKEALAAGGDQRILGALIGLLAYRLGNLSEAIAQLENAHRHAPSDVTVAANLVDALIAEKRSDRALEIATDALASSDRSHRLLRLRAYLLQLSGRFSESSAAYQAIVAADPSDFESWNNLGNAAADEGDLILSIAALKHAVALQPGVAPARINLAVAQIAAGLFDEAEETLRQAINDFPDDVKPVTELAGLLMLANRNKEAAALLEIACDRNPGNAELWVALGGENFLAWKPAEAEAALSRALLLRPTHTEANVLFAVLLEQTGRADELDRFLNERVVAAAPEGVLDFIRALVCKRDNRFVEGLAVLKRISDEIEPVRCRQLAGQFQDRLGEVDLAFASFEKMNAELASDPTDPRSRAARHCAEVRAECQQTTERWYRSWRPVSRPGQPSPCFLVGFPRSGTTLLDTLLMGHPNVSVMEERPALDAVKRSLTSFHQLAILDDNQISDLRGLYYDEAARWIESSSTQLVDKFPLHLNNVPLIHRLFPRARFILTLRHPCDVMLSSFTTNFQLNNAMSNFIDLQSAAAFYDLTFSFWERARKVMPIKVHTIMYEDMIVDPESYMRRLLDYLDLEWSDDVLDHQRSAANRGIISTASYAQVTQPIYHRSAGRWTRYRKHLEPVLPILAQWVDKFGYSLDG